MHQLSTITGGDFEILSGNQLVLFSINVGDGSTHH